MHSGTFWKNDDGMMVLYMVHSPLSFVHLLKIRVHDTSLLWTVATPMVVMFQAQIVSQPMGHHKGQVAEVII